MRTIALEEHYATEAFMEGPGWDLKAQAEAARDHPRVAAGFAKLIEQLCDLGEGIELRVMSRSGRPEEAPTSTHVNHKSPPWHGYPQRADQPAAANS
jgi:hypothetical protein